MTRKPVQAIAKPMISDIKHAKAKQTDTVSEFLEFIWRLIDVLYRLLELSSDYTPSRRKRVFSFGFVMCLLLAAAVERALLQFSLGGSA
jgi:hypothetical protein